MMVDERLLELLPPASAELVLTPPLTLTTTDSNDSSNDEERPRKKRKSTYATRREEAESMKNELAQLTHQLSDLKRHRQAQGREAANRSATDCALALNANEYMRSLIQQQQQVLVGIHSTLSDWMSDEPSMNPLTSFIHLSSDAQHRRNTLMAMKQQKLAKTEQLLRARNRSRSLFRPYSVTSQCETEQGDFCCVHAEIIQIKWAKSARQVYDGLMMSMANMEISVSEKLGDITVREEYDTMKDGVANYRMRTWENPIAPQETNSVIFTQFYENKPYNESSDDKGYGVTVIDFVDQDDLYPYRPDQNIRRDLTIACTISAHRDPRNPQEVVVVIQRASFIKIHSSNLIKDEAVLSKMRKGITKWCDVCYSSMREYATTAQNYLSPLTPSEVSLDGF